MNCNNEDRIGCGRKDWDTDVTRTSLGHSRGCAGGKRVQGHHRGHHSTGKSMWAKPRSFLNSQYVLLLSHVSSFDLLRAKQKVPIVMMKWLCYHDKLQVKLLNIHYLFVATRGLSIKTFFEKSGIMLSIVSVHTYIYIYIYTHLYIVMHGRKKESVIMVIKLNKVNYTWEIKKQVYISVRVSQS